MMTRVDDPGAPGRPAESPRTPTGAKARIGELVKELLVDALSGRAYFSDIVKVLKRYEERELIDEDDWVSMWLWAREISAIAKAIMRRIESVTPPEALAGVRA